MTGHGRGTKLRWIFRYPDIEETHIFSCDTFVKTDKKTEEVPRQEVLEGVGGAAFARFCLSGASHRHEFLPYLLRLEESEIRNPKKGQVFHIQNHNKWHPKMNHKNTSFQKFAKKYRNSFIWDYRLWYRGWWTTQFLCRDYNEPWGPINQLNSTATLHERPNSSVISCASWHLPRPLTRCVAWGVFPTSVFPTGRFRCFLFFFPRGRPWKMKMEPTNHPLSPI